MGAPLWDRALENMGEMGNPEGTKPCVEFASLRASLRDGISRWKLQRGNRANRGSTRPLRHPDTRLNASQDGRPRDRYEKTQRDEKGGVFLSSR